MKFKDLRIVDNFYQTSSFYPMPTILASTVSESGQTNLGAYSLCFPYYIAGKDYYAMIFEVRNSSNTAQNILRTGKVTLNFIPDKRKYFKEAVRLGFPGDTTEQKMKDCIFTLIDSPQGEGRPQMVEESFQIFECTWVSELEDAYLDKPEEAIPNVPLTFYTFHFMVTVGGYLLLFLLLALLFVYKPDILNKAKWSKWWHRLAIITIPLTYLCSASGWIVAEVGRQPWTIQDLMPNKVAISDLSAGYVQTTFWIFAVVFTALLIADIGIICKQISKKSQTDLDTVND